MPKVLQNREKVILSATIGIIVFAVIFNFSIGPVLNKNDDLNKDIKLTLSKLSKYKRLLSQKDYIQNKYSNLSSGMKIGQAGKQDDGLLGALAEIERLAKGSNITIVDIRPKNTNEGSRLYKEIPIDLRTEGNIESYLKFIYDLESSLALLKIKEFQLNTKPNIQYLEGIFLISQLSISD